MKDEKGELFKKTYIAFVGAAPQDVGAVIAIYETCLKQVKEDFPHLKFVIDKSDKAGCYHNETFFFWKATWPKTIGLKFKETMFNERQSGKDQCDRDSATAKRQMKYYVEGGKNIESAVEMNEALRTTALCGFNSCVLEIEDRSEYGRKQKTISDISKVHSIKYLYNVDDFTLHVWQFYGIGCDKVFPVVDSPAAPKYSVTIPFDSENRTVARARKQATSKSIIYCPEIMCVESFTSVASLRDHLDFGKHVYATKNVPQIEKVKGMWVERFSVGSSKPLPSREYEGIDGNTEKEALAMGWAISKRLTRRLTNQQKSFLNKIFDQGEVTNNKVTAEATLAMLKDEFEVEHYLPLNTIKSYFSRRARDVRDGKVVIGKEVEIQHDDPVEENQEAENVNNEEEGDNDEEDERDDAVKLIETSVFATYRKTTGLWLHFLVYGSLDNSVSMIMKQMKSKFIVLNGHLR